MIDDIGLGYSLANAVYLWLILLTVLVFVILLLFLKRKMWAFWFVSLMANFILFLNVLGSRIEWYKYIAVIVWPAINLVWLIILLLKKKKK